MTPEDREFSEINFVCLFFCFFLFVCFCFVFFFFFVCFFVVVYLFACLLGAKINGWKHLNVTFHMLISL